MFGQRHRMMGLNIATAPTISLSNQSSATALGGGTNDISIGTYTGVPTGITATVNGSGVSASLTFQGGDVYISAGNVYLHSTQGSGSWDLQKSPETVAVTLSNAGGSANGSMTMTLTDPGFVVAYTGGAFSWNHTTFVNTPYSTSITGAPITSFTVTVGAMPAGISIAAGNFQGIPAAGSYSWTIQWHTVNQYSNTINSSVAYSATVS